MRNFVKSALRQSISTVLLILHTGPAAFSADPKLVRNSLLLLPEPLDIQAVTGESESGDSV